MTTQEAVRPKTKELLARMALDVVGEEHLEPTPRLAVGLDRVDLFCLEAILGVEERRIDIRPQGLATEVGDLNGVPRRVRCLPRERLLGILSKLLDAPVTPLDFDSVRLKYRLALSSSKVRMPMR